MKRRIYIPPFLFVLGIILAIFVRNKATEPDDAASLLSDAGSVDASVRRVHGIKPVKFPVSLDTSMLSTGVLHAMDYSEAENVIADNRKVPGVIPGEQVLRFGDSNDLNAFLALVRGKRIIILDVLESSHAVRIGFEDISILDELLKSAPEPEEQSGNYYVRLPDKSPQVPLTPSSGYVGFGANSLLWLGVDEDNASWGKGVVVAVLDTGIANHPVLENAAIERVTIASDSDGVPDETTMGHGTAMASLIAGSGGGVSGVAPSASILSLDVMGADGVSDSFTLAKGIYQAVDAGARVINISMGSEGDSFILKSAVDYAVANDVVIVASTGNDATEGVLYPARYESVIAVSGVDAAGRHLYFANRGKEVDISAPALGVLAAADGGGVTTISGTSASAAFVSGALAWMFSDKADLTSAEAVQILLENANDVGKPGRDDRSGEGVLNIARIKERNIPGIYDVAVGNPYVERDESGNAVVTLFVENRGTEPISKVEFAGVVGGIEYYVDYYNLQVGAVQSYQVLLGRDQMRGADGVKVECMATLDGVLDSRLVNNSAKGSIMGDGQ